jgi:hypothetical protein
VADFFGQAKKASTHVASAAARAADLATDLHEQAASTAAALSEQATKLRETGTNKVIEAIDGFNAALPIVREAGYDLSDVSVELGLPPRVVAAFTVANEVSVEQFEALIATHAERKFAILLLKALREAWKLQSRIHIIGMTPRGMSVELGLTPSVTIKFR